MALPSPGRRLDGCLSSQDFFLYSLMRDIFNGRRSNMADSTLPDTILAHEPMEEIEAFLVPTRPKSLGFQLLYGLANATIGIGNITFYTLLLPARIALVAPSNQTTTFLLISGIGAL